MERNIKDAVKLYSGDKPFGLFAQRLPENLSTMNFIFGEIRKVFRHAGIQNFEKNPEEPAECRKFAELFRKFHNYLEAAQIQGFTWKQLQYSFVDEESGKRQEILLELDETTYLILVKRYKELMKSGPPGGGTEIPFDMDGYITTIDTQKIDSDYMNSQFEKYMKVLFQDGASAEEIQKAEDELHQTFATLSQEEQKYADIFLHDIQRGDITVVQGKTMKEYIIEYMARAKDDQIHRVAQYVLGLDEQLLRKMMSSHVTEENINEFGRLDELKATVDRERAQAYFEAITGTKMPIPKVNIKVDKLLRDFILNGGYDLEIPDEIMHSD